MRNEEKLRRMLRRVVNQHVKTMKQLKKLKKQTSNNGIKS